MPSSIRFILLWGLCVLLLVCSTYYPLCAQSADADSLAWKKWHLLSKQYMGTQPDSALFFAGKALYLAEKHAGKQSIRLMQTYTQIATIYAYVLEKPAQAMPYADTLIEEGTIHKTPNAVAAAYQIKSHCYNLLGRYEKAMEQMVEAIRIYETPPVDGKRLGTALINMGTISGKTDPQQAILCYKRAYAVLPAEASERFSARFNIGACLGMLGKYDSAILVCRDVAAYWRNTNDVLRECEAGCSIGAFFIEQQQFDSARVYLNRVLARCEETGITVRKSNALMLLARSYEKQGLAKQAVKPFLAALTLKDSTQWYFNIGLYQTGSHIYLQLKDYKTANEYLLRMLAAKDSLAATEARRKAEITRENYELDKRDRKIADLAAEKDRQTRQRNLAFAGAGVLLLLTAAGYTLLRSRQKIRLQQAELAHSIALNEQQEADRRQLAGELHDGVAQDLMLLRQALTHANQPDLAQQADASIDSLRTTARFLYPASLAQTGLQSALHHLLSQWEAKTPVFLAYEFEYPAGWVPVQQEIHLYRFVQEAVTNALKHASPKAISVEMEQAEGKLRVRVRDNGQGFDAAAALSRPNSFGLLSLQHRAKQLGGSLSINSQLGSGTTLTLMIPPQKP